MIISNEGNKIIDSNGVVIVSKKTGEWEVVSGGGGGGALWVTGNSDGILDKTYTELKTAVNQGNIVLLKMLMQEDGDVTNVLHLVSLFESSAQNYYNVIFLGMDSWTFSAETPDGQLHYEQI